MNRVFTMTLSVMSCHLRGIAGTLALACLWLAAPALAQAPGAGSCLRYRAELAGLSNEASTARALQSEIGRLEAYYRTLGCEGGKFLFFDTRPPQCGAVEQRIRALNAGYGSDNGEVAAARRRQLQQAVAAACVGLPEGVTLRNGESYASGGAQVICVRTCDGAFFPMKNLPEGRSGSDEMCQALCPGAEAVAYSMPYGDNALRSAATVKGGRAYASLANAFKFQKDFVPNCSCKREGQTWAQSLAKAESMLVRHKGDIFVTPMQAEALSRPNPKVRLTLVGRADKTAAALAADAAVRTGDLPAPAEPPRSTLSEGAVAAIHERAGVRIIAPDIVAAPAR